MAGKRRSDKREKAAAGIPDESRAVEAITAIWVLVIANTLLCLLGSAVAQGYVNAFPGANAVLVLSRLLLLAALVLGVVLLLLTIAVLKLRRQRPPLGVTIFAVLVGITPIAATIVVQYAS
jgi:hypothetical protein